MQKALSSGEGFLGGDWDWDQPPVTPMRKIASTSTAQANQPAVKDNVLIGPMPAAYEIA
jgi:hypothetical protein